jgi:hypothetical protein
MTAGRSWRTPAKHALMDRIFGAEAGAASRMPYIERLEWIDLTAGDGLVSDGAVGGWARNCSPGILALHAFKSLKPVRVTLYERDRRIYQALQAVLEEQMPGFGYCRAEDGWRGRNAHVRLIHGNGKDADLSGVDRWTAVLASNDPNNIAGWAMRPRFAAEVRERTKWFRSISTMGCNPAGLKRLPYEERVDWFEHVRRQAETLPPHHDLLLAEIDRDDAQWAYLLCDAAAWRDKAEVNVRSAFGKCGLSVTMAWLRLDESGFSKIAEHLFLTRKERDQ